MEIRRDARAALAAGGLVGVLGGLIGLGGAEFRLPILIGCFRYGLRAAAGVNLLMSLVTVTVAAATRLAWGPAHEAVDLVGVAVPLMAGGMPGHTSGRPWLTGVSETQLRRAIRALLLLIGTLLIAEAAFSWDPRGLVLGAGGQLLVGAVAGWRSASSAVCSAWPVGN